MINKEQEDRISVILNSAERVKIEEHYIVVTTPRGSRYLIAPDGESEPLKGTDPRFIRWEEEQ